MVLRPDRGDEFMFAPEGPGSAGRGEIWSVLELWSSRDANRLAALRSRYLGYVLQHGGLLPYLSVRANIELPRQLLSLPSDDSADRLADRLGIAQQLNKRPA
jgi:putative ABC transport system ATP-binding protein